MKFLKSTILYSLFVGSLFVAFSFFLFPQNASACELQLDSSLRFRTATTNGGIQPETWFTEDNPPFVYVDFKTINCTDTDTFYLTVFGISDSGTIVKTVDSYPLSLANLDENQGMSVSFHPDEEPCFGDNSDTSESDCLVFAAFTNQPTTSAGASILGLIGDLIGSVSLEQAQLFANQFGGGNTSPSSGCSNLNGYYYQTSQNCAISSLGWIGLFGPGLTNSKLVDYYNTYGGSYQLLAYSETVQVGKVGYPGLLYNCEGSCAFNDGWEPIPNNILPYGETMSDDEGVVTVNPLAEIYQEEYVPLAPLPFEGLNGGSTPNLGQYLASMFKMGIVVVIILAVIMIVFHGIALATVGAIQKKTEHKEGVWNAILGLVLALGSWLLLNTVSPELASNLGVGIPEVTLEGDAESISSSSITNSSGTITAFTLPSDLGLYCPGGGGPSNVASIIDSFENKVTYRWGGKGGNLGGGQQFRLSPSEQSNGPHMCSDNGQNVPCRNFCPDNSICLDCSGFVNHVRQCAGLSIYSGTSSMVSSSAAIAVDMGTLSSNGQSLTVNGSPYTLQAGDILVWNGHVVIYYGNGIIAESKGDSASVKNPNQNIKKTSLAQSSYKNKITHLIKAVP